MSVSTEVESTAPYVEVSCRADDKRGSKRRRPLLDCATARFEDAVPVRPFRWSWGGRHFPGWYWAATTGQHVGFESWSAEHPYRRPGRQGTAVSAWLTSGLLRRVGVIRTLGVPLAVTG